MTLDYSNINCDGPRFCLSPLLLKDALRVASFCCDLNTPRMLFANNFGAVSAYWFLGIQGNNLGSYRDNGKENGNLLGLLEVPDSIIVKEPAATILETGPLHYTLNPGLLVAAL